MAFNFIYTFFSIPFQHKYQTRKSIPDGVYRRNIWSWQVSLEKAVPTAAIVVKELAVLVAASLVQPPPTASYWRSRSFAID
jgi:hypothetical protein